MKATALGLILLGFAFPSLSVEKPELDNRIRLLTEKLEALQQTPEKSIPAENLYKAQGILLLDRTKAGFIFAYQGGSGVAMVRNPDSRTWGPLAFMSANEASLGFQIGGQKSFVVILFMNTNAVRMLTEPNVEFGGEARGTAGDSTAGVEGKVVEPEQPVLVYTDRIGLYGGATVKGGALSPDNEANRVYYGESLSVRDILFDKKAKPTEAATALATSITQYSKAAKK